MANIASAVLKNSSTNSSKNSSGMDHLIAKQAYYLYLERGSKHGHDREDWLRAEQIVKNRK